MNKLALFQTFAQAMMDNPYGSKNGYIGQIQNKPKVKRNVRNKISKISRKRNR